MLAIGWARTAAITGAMPELNSAVFLRDLGRAPIVITQGDGVFLFDAAGRRYLDAAAGAAVASLGHGNREIAETITRQSQTLTYAHPEKFATEPMLELASMLAERAPPGITRVYFTSGGSESTEAAIKLARQYHHVRGVATKYKTLSRRVSYHGATLGALAISGQLKRRELFMPLLMCEPQVAGADSYRCGSCRTEPACTLDCAEDLERVIAKEGAATVAAFVAEPIVGSSNPGSYPPDDYWRRIREICDRNDVLFIADEVMSGNGRSGHWWAMQHSDVTPDIILTAKGIGAGYAALGAVLTTEGVYETVRRSGSFRHGHTYAGNPLACAVGCQVIRIIERDGLLDNVRRMGKLLLHGLEEVLIDHPLVGTIRGRGLLLGVEFVEDKAARVPFPVDRDIQTKVALACLSRGLYVYQGGGSAGGHLGDHVLIAPPFMIDERNVEEIVSSLKAAVDEVMERETT